MSRLLGCIKFGNIVHDTNAAHNFIVNNDRLPMTENEAMLAIRLFNDHFQIAETFAPIRPIKRDAFLAQQRFSIRFIPSVCRTPVFGRKRYLYEFVQLSCGSIHACQYPIFITNHNADIHHFDNTTHDTFLSSQDVFQRLSARDISKNLNYFTNIARIVP